MKKKLITLILVILLITSLAGFVFINQNNYILIKEEKAQYVKHPELLPEKNIVKYTSFGFSNLKADIYWLETIQYIGSNVISSEYKKFLFEILDLITELNPYFEKPYLIGQLLLPNYNERYEELSSEEINSYNLKAEKIGEKGILNFCNSDKIKLIESEENLQELWSNEKYKNPCNDSEIPLQQAFLEFFYLKDHKKSYNYYKIASANDDSLIGAKIMAGIMGGKSGNREISVMTFLTLAESKSNDDEICTGFINDLSNLSSYVFQNGNTLTKDYLKQINSAREEYFPFSKENDDALSSDSCQNYINKAIRQFNLEYLDEANIKYFKDKNEYAQTPQDLFNNGYIDYIPVDFQQYDEYGIEYYYNDETKNFDTQMSN